MSDINTLTLSGRVVAKPKTYQTDDYNITRFSLATTEHYKSGEQIKERTSFINVGVYDKYAAEKAAKLDKGQEVLIQGSIETHSYESEGSTRTATEIALRPGSSLLKVLGVTSKKAEPITGLGEAIGPREKQQMDRHHAQ